VWVCRAAGIRLAWLSVLLALFTGCRPTPPPHLRSLVLISVDTLRADRLNSYGYRSRRVSPAIDRLARDGVLFEGHISASPWTTPSHMSLLTSLSPSAHGVTRPFAEIRESLEGQGSYVRLAESDETLALMRLIDEIFLECPFYGARQMDASNYLAF